ncbi:MAG: response regulator [Sphaerochaetaceae bacterium]|nr:response regulator [Sphaerochaetaceae bacterium]
MERLEVTSHVVVTDDDSAIRKVLQIFLQKSGYIVTLCKNGEELLQLLEVSNTTVDLIFLDIKMPGLSGLELLEIIQQKYPLIPVIMLTAFNDLDTGMKAMRLGAKDYLAKPVSREILLTSARRILAESASSRSELAKQVKAIAHQKELENQLQIALGTIDKVTRATLLAFSETIEQKDAYTKGHCNRVSIISVAIAKAFRLPPESILVIEEGALLHDIGKIGISEQILNKSSTLTKEEYEIIKMHPVYGERIISHIELFQPYRSIIRSHHERIDGKGYPDGLKGEEIPLSVAMVSLADAFDSMTSDRAYRSAMSVEIVLEEIKLFSGTQFHPDVVDVFIDKELYLL